MAKKKRTIKAKDLYQIELISGTRLAPDGKLIVYAKHRVDEKTQKKYANLWVAFPDGHPPRQLTYGEQNDTYPVWAPDSSQVAFFSNRGSAEKPPQIYLIATSLGEARPLTSIKGVIGGMDWSPDGKTLICLVRKTDKEALEREADEQKKKLGVVARHYDRIYMKSDGQGFLPKEGWHIWSVDIKSGKAKQLTDHKLYEESMPSWSPDGKTLVFTSNRSENPDFQPELEDLFTMPAKGGEMTRIPTPPGNKFMPVFSPNGKWIAYYGNDGVGEWYKNNALWIVPADGSAPPRNLTEKHDVHVSATTLNDTSGVEMMPPTWAKDSQSLYFQVDKEGSTYLMQIDLAGEKMEKLLGEKSAISSFSLNRENTLLAYVEAKIDDPGQIHIVPLEHGKPNGTARTLTDLNAAWLAQLDLGQTEEVWFKGPDGNDLQGWILTPPGFDPAKQYPSILEIHGGPMMQYGFHFMYEFYYLAAQGYVVYYSNPRGGRGYGEAHTRANWNDWGNVDYADLMAWADYVAQKPYIDTARMGVTGGSYGGYMTNWIIGHTTRFKAAVTQRSICNLVSFYGSTDGNWIWQQVFGGSPPWENLDNYWRMSPLKYIAAAKTPTLIIHSENDLRCPIEQAEQLYVALKRVGVESEIVRFPEESHGLSRGGRTDRRIERLKQFQRWFGKYLAE